MRTTPWHALESSSELDSSTQRISPPRMKLFKSRATCKPISRSLISTITFYTIRISCPWTKSLWTIQLRFSQAYAARKALLEMVDACPLPLQADILAFFKSFPRRRLGLDNEFVIAERAEGLKNYVMALMQVLELCGHHADPAVVALKTQVDEILNLPVIYKMDTFNKSTDQLVDGMCSICLDDMQDNDAC
ncbi:unnamed protein product, partial [Aphanomyces euteiches]